MMPPVHIFVHSMEPLRVVIEAPQPVSGLWLIPADARACYVFAHGAGAGMTHPFMQAVAAGLFDRAIATLRYQFPYMEKGARSGRTLRRLPTLLFGPPLPRRRADARSCRSSPGANHSAPA